MNRDFLLVIDSMAGEKDIPRDDLLSAIELALATALKKRYKIEDEDRDYSTPKDVDIVVRIDRENGEISAFRRWEVVNDADGLQEPDRQEIFSDAREDYPEIQVGEFIEKQIELEDFGRIGVQVAKNLIAQRVREVERENNLNEFLKHGEEIFSGTVKRIDKGDLIVESGKIEARLPRSEMIPKETFRMGDRVRAWIKTVDRESRNQALTLSRIAPEFVKYLFEYEVPEIEQGMLAIRAVSRDPGLRSKVAVQALDKRIDPVGACIGMRFSRVNAVKDEINGEQIDIIQWAEDPAEFVISALSPATVDSIEIDDEEKTMYIVVEEENLAKAIGTRGQNVRLAADLTGWQLKLMSHDQNDDRLAKEQAHIRTLFAESLNVDDDLVDVLIEEGFTSLEEIAYVPEEELLMIDGFEQEIVTELRSRAKSALLTYAIRYEELAKEAEDDLLSLEGIASHHMMKILESGIKTRDDLADLGTDELSEILGVDEKEAGDIIMLARAHWFE